jgi:hypothetical protein
LIGPHNNFSISSQSCLIYIALESESSTKITKEAAEKLFGPVGKYSRLRRSVDRLFGYAVFRDDTETFDIQNHVRVINSKYENQENEGIISENEFFEDISKFFL